MISHRLFFLFGWISISKFLGGTNSWKEKESLVTGERKRKIGESEEKSQRAGSFVIIEAHGARYFNGVTFIEREVVKILIYPVAMENASTGDSRFN